jgi:hypothetical protein
VKCTISVAPSENTGPPKDSLQRLNATTRDPRQRYRSMGMDAHDTTLLLLEGFGAETGIGGALETAGLSVAVQGVSARGSSLNFISTTRASLAATANSQIILCSVQS